MNKSWQLITTDNKTIQFPESFVNYAKLLEDKILEEPLNVLLDSATLTIILKFCEAHNFDLRGVRINKPIRSNNILENLDLQSWTVLNVREELFDKVLHASYYLDFKILKKACLVILGCQLYIGDDEQEYVKAKEKYGIGEITPQQEIQIMEEYREAFEKQAKKYNDDILKAEKDAQLIL